jgi:hypothetical protein
MSPVTASRTENRAIQNAERHKPQANFEHDCSDFILLLEDFFDKNIDSNIGIASRWCGSSSSSCRSLTSFFQRLKSWGELIVGNVAKCGSTSEEDIRTHEIIQADR